MGCCNGTLRQRNQQTLPGAPQIVQRRQYQWHSTTPLTREQLDRDREEFWDTAALYDGKTLEWQAIRSACTETDQALVQAILDAARITIPVPENYEDDFSFGSPIGTSDSRTSRATTTAAAANIRRQQELVCYDALGTQYIIPVRILADPVNLIVPPQEQSHENELDGSGSSRSRQKQQPQQPQQQQQQQQHRTSTITTTTTTSSMVTTKSRSGAEGSVPKIRNSLYRGSSSLATSLGKEKAAMMDEEASFVTSHSVGSSSSNRPSMLPKMPASSSSLGGEGGGRRGGGAGSSSVQDKTRFDSRERSSSASVSSCSSSLLSTTSHPQSDETMENNNITITTSQPVTQPLPQPTKALRIRLSHRPQEVLLQVEPLITIQSIRQYLLQDPLLSGLKPNDGLRFFFLGQRLNDHQEIRTLAHFKLGSTESVLQVQVLSDAITPA